MFDISHLASTNDPLLYNVSQDLFDVWNAAPADVTIQDVIETLPNQLPPDSIFGQHYFNENASGGLDPIWDFRALSKFQGNENAVFVAKVLTTTPADDPKNVALVHLGKVSGDILDEVYRLFTVGGVPPDSVSLSASCLIPWMFDAYAPLCSLDFVSATARGRVPPSNTLLIIGFLAVPWAWVATNFWCPIWGAPTLLPPIPFVCPAVMLMVEGIESYVMYAYWLFVYCIF